MPPRREGTRRCLPAETGSGRIGLLTVSRDMVAINKALTCPKRNWVCVSGKSRRSPAAGRRRKMTGGGLEDFRIRAPLPKPAGAAVPPVLRSPPTTVCATTEDRWWGSGWWRKAEKACSARSQRTGDLPSQTGARGI